MVKALHRAGIEVIFDVVFNHTAEGDQNGPTICFRGSTIRRITFWKTADRDTPNYTGCGNTFNANQPIVRRLIVDSLRIGSRRCTSMDSASIWRRFFRAMPPGHPIPNPPVLWDIDSDPALAGTKLFAEAWDAAGLYQVGCVRRRFVEGMERPVPRRHPRFPPRRARIARPQRPIGSSAAMKSMAISSARPSKA